MSDVEYALTTPLGLPTTTFLLSLEKAIALTFPPVSVLAKALAKSQAKVPLTKSKRIRSALIDIMNFIIEMAIVNILIKLNMT